MNKLLISALVAGLIAGCSSTPKTSEINNAPVEDRSASTNPIAPEGGIATITAPTADGQGLPRELTDPNSILSKRSVYFDYDKYEVKEEFRSLVSAHAKFLSTHPQFKMLIQGNTDERGSREYNLALGQKRADAVKRMLVLLGARDEQIESVSLGEEKPKAAGHDESAWGENRRGDMLYSGEF